MKQYLEVGLLNNTHGVRGEMKLTLWCDDLDYLRRFQVLYLDPEGQRPLHVTSLRPQSRLHQTARRAAGGSGGAAPAACNSPAPPKAGGHYPFCGDHLY